MKDNLCRLFLVLAGFVLSGGCGDHLAMREGSTTDIDGNLYRTVRIGDQWWMAENLRVRHYADGTPIPDGTFAGSQSLEPSYFAGAGTKGDACCVADDVVFYNWPAAMRGQASSNRNPSGVQGLAPDGWHLPSLAEWQQLRHHLSIEGNSGPGTEPGKKLEGPKSSSGFDALKAGAWWQGEPLPSAQDGARFWTATVADEEGSPQAVCVCVDGQSGLLIEHAVNQAMGCSVRCVKDK